MGVIYAQPGFSTGLFGSEADAHLFSVNHVHSRHPNANTVHLTRKFPYVGSEALWSRESERAASLRALYNGEQVALLFRAGPTYVACTVSL